MARKKTTPATKAVAGRKSTAMPGAKPKPKPKPNANAKAKPPARRAAAARVRMYRQGLGDCFLIAFPKPAPARGDVFILIDCGVILGTPRADDLMKAVVADIAETTGRHLDVLVATHEHWDHVSAFEPAKGLFRDFRIDAVWLAWTEDPDDPIARQIRRDRANKLAALRLGFAALRRRVEATLGTAPPGGPGDADRRELEAVGERIGRAAQVLSFFGIDPDEDPPPPPTGGGLGASGDPSTSRVGAAMTWVREATEAPKFWKPGDVIELPEAGGVRAFVLGPPTDLAQLHKDLPTRSGRETYDEPAGLGLASSVGGDVRGPGPDFDPAVPFDRKHRIEPEDARTIDFFRDHYFGGDDAWRRIEGDWTDAAAGLALQLDGDTNNTSLALAFELPDGRVLLFPGDAQVGNWESWHADSAGTKRTWKVGDRAVTAEQLLNRTVLYKVGHHGSHNATLRERGLEMMTDPTLAAMVPVDVFVAHEKKRWMKMPFPPLLSRLEERTGGRVLQADRPASPTGPNSPGTDSAKQVEVVIDDRGNTEMRPLYVDHLT